MVEARKVSDNLLSRLQSYSTPICRIRSIGIHLPKEVVDNEHLVSLLEVDDALKKRLPTIISRMTGIESRRYAPKGTMPSDLALKAAKKALCQEGLVPEDIDTLIFASTDTDVFEPATANILQEKLKLNLINSFDVKNACNSILQAINLANSLIASKAAKRILIASGEMGSYACNRTLKNKDELSVKLGGYTLGDAGAALIIEPSDGKTGILEINMITIGKHWPLCHVPENPSWRSYPIQDIGMWFYLNMPELIQIAREWTIRYFKEYLSYRYQQYNEDSPLDLIDHIIPHQLSKRFIDVMANVVGIDSKKVCVIAEKYGNTASTTIPIGLQTLIDGHKISLGCNQELMLFGAASGFNIAHIRLRI